jgi:hypothetical protein
MTIFDSAGNACELSTLGIAPVVSLSAVSATGPGTALDGEAVRQNAVATVTTSAGVSAGSVVLEGGLDGTNFVTLGSAVTTSSASTTYTVAATNVFMRYVRARVTTAITAAQFRLGSGCPDDDRTCFRRGQRPARPSCGPDCAIHTQGHGAAPFSSGA